ncbi:hypothetical protein [Nocardioides sp.]|uniref:hypothetical protein n=1 Tax=Nocardioides sp. TaxID=35761 RepID=UPI00321B296B
MRERLPGAVGLCLASALAVTGCTSGQGRPAEAPVPPAQVSDPPSGAADEAPDPRSHSARSTDQMSGEELRTARRVMEDAGEGSFSTSFEAPGVYVRTRGTFDLRQPGYRTTTEVFTDSFGDYTFRAVSIDDVTFLHSSRATRACWAAFEGSELQVLQEPGAAAAPTGPIACHPSLLVLFEARRGVRGYDADLALVGSVLGAGIATALGIEPDLSTRTPVQLEVLGDGGYAWSATLGSIVRSARRAGSDVPRETVEGLADSEISTTLRPARTGYPIHPPPRDIVVDFDAGNPGQAAHDVAECLGEQPSGSALEVPA